MPEKTKADAAEFSTAGAQTQETKRAAAGAPSTHLTHEKERRSHEDSELASDSDAQNRDEYIDCYVAKLDELMTKFGRERPTRTPLPAGKE